MPDVPTPIQDAVAWLRRKKNAAWTPPPEIQAIFDQQDHWANAIEAQGREIERLREALKAARDLIQTVMDTETTVSFLTGEVTTSMPAPDFDAVLAQIDEATKS